MKILKITISLMFLVVISTSSCSKDSPDGGQNAYVMINGPYFRIVDENNQPYFETANVNFENVEFYKIVNGELQSANVPFLTKTDPLGRIVFSIDCRESVPGHNFKTVIKWNETDQDTITYSYTVWDGGIAGLYSEFNAAPFEPNDGYGIYTFRRTTPAGN